MSKNRKNFHYHYAEQYETRAERIERRRRAVRKTARRPAPPAALIAALVLLAIFGLISVSSSVVVSTSEEAVTASGRSLAALAQIHNVWREMEAASSANNSNTAYRQESSDISGGTQGADEGIDAPAEEMPKVVRGVLELAETGTDTTTSIPLFVKVSSDWTNDGARFAVYFLGGSNVSDIWKDLIQVKDNLYYLTMPSGYTKFIICRMNGSTTENNWDNKWNQTADIVYDSTKNYYYNSGWGGFTGDSVNFNLYSGSTKIGSMSYSSGTSYTYTLSDFVASASSHTFCVKAETSSDTVATFANKTVSFYNGATYDVNFTFNCSTIGSNTSGLSDPTKTQKTWPVTVYAGANGSVGISGSTVNANSNSTFFVSKTGTTITANPVDGYLLDSWSVTGEIELDNENSDSPTVRAKSNAAAGGAGTVTATFAASSNCSVAVSEHSLSLDLGDISSVTVSAYHHAVGDITVASNSDKVKVSSSQNSGWGSSVTFGNITGGANPITSATLYIKGMSPTDDNDVVLTAYCESSNNHTTHAATISVSVSRPEISVDDISGVIIDSSGTFSPTLSNPSSLRGTVTYSKTTGSGDPTISLDGDYGAAYTALCPGTTYITASYAYSHNGVTCTVTDDFTVTVAQPTLDLNTLSIEEFMTKDLSVNTSGTSPMPVSVEWTVTGGAAIYFGEPDTTTTTTTTTTNNNIKENKVAVTAPANNTNNGVKASISVTAHYEHHTATFTFSESDNKAPVTVTSSPVYFNYNSGSNSTTEEPKMTYDPVASSTLTGSGSAHDVYKCTVSLQHTTYYFRLWNGTNHYNGASNNLPTVTETISLSSGGYQLYLDSNDTGKWPILTTGSAGVYTVYFDKTSNKFYVIYPRDEYYVLGDFNSWEGAKLDYVESGNYYQFELTAGAANSSIVRGSTYHFKFSKNAVYDTNKLWTGNYTFTSNSTYSNNNTVTLSDNQSSSSGVAFTVRANGTYTFILTPGSTAPTLRVIYPDDEYYLIGSFLTDSNGWVLDSETYKFTDANNDGIYELPYDVNDSSAMKKGQGYRIKVGVNGQKDTPKPFTSSGSIYDDSINASTRIASTTLTTEGSGGSNGLEFYVGANSKVNDQYVFTFNPANGTLTIHYPEDDYYLAKEDNGQWSATESLKFSPDHDDQDKLKVTFTVSDDEGLFSKGTDYNVRIVKNGNLTFLNHNYIVNNFSDISTDISGRITRSVGTTSPIKMKNGIDSIPITIGANGTYTVTFNPTDANDSTTPSFSIAYPADSYYLVGTFNTGSGENPPWYATDRYKFTETETSNVWELEVNVPESYTPGMKLNQTYNIKISKNGSFTHNTYLYGTSSSVSVDSTTENITLSNSDSGSQEIGFKIGAAGKYTFTFDLRGSTPKLSIDYPGRAYYLLGFGSAYWDTAFPDSARLMAPDDSGNYVCTLSTNGNLGSAISKDHSYSGNNDGFCVYCTDGTYYYTATAITGSVTSTALSRQTSKPTPISLTTRYGGAYIFSLCPGSSSSTLSVTYPQRTVNKSAESSVGTVGLNNANVYAYLNLDDANNDAFTARLTANSYYTINSWKILDKNNVDITNNLAGTGVSINSGSVASGTGVTSDFGITVTTEDAVTVVAVLRPNTFNVVIYTDGATLDTPGDWGVYDQNSKTYTRTRYYGEEVTLPVENELTQPVPGDPWTYDGWYGKNDYTGSEASSVGQWTAENKNYYLHWIVQVTFSDNVRKEPIGDPIYITHGTSVSQEHWATVDTDSNYPLYIDKDEDNIDDFERSSTWVNCQNPEANTTVYRIYLPIAKEFVLDLTGTYKDGDGSVDDPFVFELEFGIQVTGTAEVIYPYDNSDSNAGFTYKWCLNSGEYAVGNTNSTYRNTNMVDTGSTVVSYAGKIPVALYSKAYYTDGVTEQTWESSSSTVKYFYYLINSPLNGLEFRPKQKIYQIGSNTVNNVSVLFQEDPESQDALNIADETVTVNNESFKKYQASLLYFDTSTKTYRYLNQSTDNPTLNDIADDSSVTHGFVSVFDQDFIKNHLNETGVKYFNAEIWRYDESESGYVQDSKWGTPIHTTVGTTSTAASQPLYLVNSLSSGHSFNDEDYPKRVMVFYINKQNGLGYQTARPFIREGATDSEVYRFDLPADVTSVVFGVFETDPRNGKAEYVLPRVSIGETEITIDFDGTNHLYYTDWISLSQGNSVKHVVKLSGIEANNSKHINTASLADTLS